MKDLGNKLDRECYKAKGSGKNGATLNLAAIRRSRKHRVKARIAKLIQNDDN